MKNFDFLSTSKTHSKLLVKMKEDAEKERLEQLEQEELEKLKRLSRRSSSPAMRQSQLIESEPREAQSEPITRHTPFVSFLNSLSNS